MIEAVIDRGVGLRIRPKKSGCKEQKDGKKDPHSLYFSKILTCASIAHVGNWLVSVKMIYFRSQRRYGDLKMKKVLMVLVVAVTAVNLNLVSAGPVATSSKTLQPAKIGRMSNAQYIFDVFYSKPLPGLVVVFR